MGDSGKIAELEAPGMCLYRDNNCTGGIRCNSFVTLKIYEDVLLPGEGLDSTS